jgi:hypothetical protein
MDGNDIVYSYRDVPTLRQFAHSDAFMRGISGPFGSGKSSACVAEFPQRGLAQRPGPDGIRRSRWAIIRNTMPQLRDTSIRTLHQWLPPQHFGRWYSNDLRYVIKAWPGAEIEIICLGLDRPEHVRKLLSLDLTGAWVNEAREVPWAVIEALQGRVGRYPPMNEGGPTWFGVWMDTNPPDVDSKWYEFFEEGKWKADFQELLKAGVLPAGSPPESFAAVFHQPDGLGPNAENLANLIPGYYQRLAVGKKSEWVKVYCRGQYGFVTEDKAVFPEYSDALHLKAIDPVPGRRIMRGWDFGLTPACSLSQVLPDGRWLVFDEIIAEGMGADRFGDQVLEHCARAFKGKAEFEDYGDPAGNQRAQTDEKTCFEILGAKGIEIEEGLQSVAIRLESMRKPLRTIVNGQVQFVLHPRCKTLRKGFLGGYHFRRLSTTAERYSTEPEKHNIYSHIMDGTEYVATILFGGALTTPRGGDQGPGFRTDRDETGRSSVTGY